MESCWVHSLDKGGREERCRDMRHWAAWWVEPCPHSSRSTSKFAPKLSTEFLHSEHQCVRHQG